MIQRVREWWTRVDKRALAVVLVALGVRLIWTLVVQAQAVSDYTFYYGAAAGLAAGKGYLMYGHPTAYWPLGYPLFLAVFFKLFGESLLVGKLVNVGLWTLTSWLMYVLGKRLGGPTAGLVSGLVVALYPEYVFFSGLMASENLFVLLVCAVAVLLTFEPAARRGRYGLAAAVGLLLGYGVLVRPTAILLPLTMCFIVWFLRWRRKGFTTALVIGLCALLVLAPWVIRNRIVFGEWVMSTNGGSAIWGGAHAASTGSFMRQGERPSWMGTPTTVQAEIISNNEGSKLAAQFIREHPLEWAALTPSKLRGLFGEPGGLAWNLVYHIPGHTGYTYRTLSGAEALVVKIAGYYRRFPRLMVRVQAFEWILGALGLLLAIVVRRKNAVWAFAIAAYWVLFNITLATGQPRYLVSVGPLIAPGIGFLVALAVARFDLSKVPSEASAPADD